MARRLRWAIGFVWWLGACSPAAAADATLEGTVKDRSGGVVVGARVVVMTPQRTVVATSTSDKTGAFTLDLPDGEYLVVGEAPQLEGRATVRIAGVRARVDLVLDIARVSADVTVTAAPGEAIDAARVTQPVRAISEQAVQTRAKTVVAQVVDGEPGAHLQRTGPGMAGIFIRGLTGNKVNIYLDGVRYSNGAQRGGVNTFLDLIDPSTLAGVEVLRGTASAQYGSDAMGGSVQFLTHTPQLSSTGRPMSYGSMTTGGETAHNGGMAAVNFGYARARLGVSGSAGYRKTGDYRPGGGIDSHSAIRRFLGLATNVLLPARMPDTGFRQSAAQLRVSWLAAPDLMVTASHVSTRQDGANRWDQVLGGDGNLISELNDLQLDLGYVRVEKMGLGWFDQASATYSFNTQREERVNQGGNGNINAAINHDPERTTVHGVQFNASRRVAARYSFSVGGDTYFEKISAKSFAEDPNTHAITLIRPRVPDQATYLQGGVFAQTSMELRKDVTLTGAVRGGWNRYTARQSASPLVGGTPLWPDDGLRTMSVTFRGGAAWSPASAWVVTGAVSRGYRAPHMTDLGTLGLTGSGFELAAPDVAGLNALIGTTADSSAKSTGRAVAQVTPETNLNFDLGLRYGQGGTHASINAFVNTIHGNIQKMAVILPQGAVGTLLAGEPITSQTADGAVFVALSTTPVLVRANFDRARIWGIEIDGEYAVAPDATIGGAFTLLKARDLDTRLPPNIEGGTPAPGGTVYFRVSKPEKHWWLEPYMIFAARQANLSSLDLSDRRTGATRSRTNIQNFFRRGATVRGWVRAGADGTFGNADDILIWTGETLAQVQDRVLGAGVTSAPMITALPGYFLYGVRFGLTWGPHRVVVDLENLGDRNYRGISWGMDGPGRGIMTRYTFSFGGRE